VQRFEQVGESWLLVVRAPRALGRYLAFKGSVTVNGVSLTVNIVDDLSEGCDFSVNLIPHTISVTTLRHLQAGRR
jgi:riboflavin synthase